MQKLLTCLSLVLLLGLNTAGFADVPPGVDASHLSHASEPLQDGGTNSSGTLPPVVCWLAICCEVTVGTCCWLP